MNLWRSVAYVLLSIFLGSAASLAQDVTLTSRDGSIQLTGSLIGYDGEFYEIETVYGALTLDASGVVCEGDACPDAQDYLPVVTLSGAQSIGDVLFPALVEAFASRNGFSARRVVGSETEFSYELSEENRDALVARIEFQISNSDAGIANLISGDADIALSLRAINEDEIAQAAAAGIGDLSAPRRGRVVALDALVPLVSDRNPVTDIPLRALAEIFSGETASWAALGGVDAPITLHLQARNTGIAQIFESRIMARSGKPLSADVIRHPTAAALADAVAADPFAIGIATYSETGSGTALVFSGSCGLALAADPASIKTEDYPLVAPVFIYTPARRFPRIIREFLSFIQSPAAQPAARLAGFVDQTPTAIPHEFQGGRFASAIQKAGPEIGMRELKRLSAGLSAADRLTVTFRFQDGSAALDPQSRSNIALLADAIERGDYDDRTLVFAGFSDGQGGASSNRNLSRRRAEAVRDAVVAAAPAADMDRLSFEIDGFGEALPLACDDVRWGRGINRRVEIWLR